MSEVFTFDHETSSYGAETSKTNDSNNIFRCFISVLAFLNIRCFFLSLVQNTFHREGHKIKTEIGNIFEQLKIF